MNRPKLCKWTKGIHEHCMKNSVGITPSEAVVQFGPPPSASSAASILNSALRTGWFRREEWIEQGASRMIRKTRYFAIDKANAPSSLPDNRWSYFTGLKRVSSVWELGRVV